MSLRCLFLKRPFDAALSGFGIILSFPFWIVFALLIWFEDRGPVFYIQEREGKAGRIFKAYKFRSMVKDAEKDGIPVQAEKNDPRVTPIGRLLRVTAMDELPQLFNIFKGDMSFVGPRALRPEEAERHKKTGTQVVALKDIPGYKERQNVRPGLTGLAQVYLSADAPRKVKFKYDVFYIRNQSFRLDLGLIIRSFGISFKGKWEKDQK
ncbi:MAG: sugar transferase [Candidatus Aminicenantes bacterium]|nr:sugar transferase [Candidatus Aminicenantes bacterium]